jgi:hypothetical protein
MEGSMTRAVFSRVAGAGSLSSSIHVDAVGEHVVTVRLFRFVVGVVVFLHAVLAVEDLFGWWRGKAGVAKWRAWR